MRKNAGIRQSRGEVLAFVDDDVTVEPAWLRNLTGGLRDSQWSGSGGRILPPQGFSPPPWLALQGPWGQGGALCAQFDMGDAARQITEEPPYGANMAFRKEMFEKYGGFRTDLGRCGDSLIGNEDTEFGRRLMAAANDCATSLWPSSTTLFRRIVSIRGTFEHGGSPSGVPRSERRARGRECGESRDSYSVSRTLPCDCFFLKLCARYLLVIRMSASADSVLRVAWLAIWRRYGTWR